GPALAPRRFPRMVTPAGIWRGGYLLRSMHGPTLGISVHSYGLLFVITITLPQCAVDRSLATPALVTTGVKPWVGYLPEPSVALKSQNSLSERLRTAATKGEPLAPRAFWT